MIQKMDGRRLRYSDEQNLLHLYNEGAKEKRQKRSGRALHPMINIRRTRLRARYKIRYLALWLDIYSLERRKGMRLYAS